jgi:hypothetical protein
LSKDEILNCVNGTEQDLPKYKPGAPMLSEAKVDQDYFKGGCGSLMLNIELSSVLNLITPASLMLPS